jgi:hypothetical protein
MTGIIDGAALRVEFSSDRINCFRAGGSKPLAAQHAHTDHRPFIHPLLAPDGHGVLTEDAPPHHPWQHGLYVGLNLVNGYGFWTEGLSSHPNDGSFHPAPLKSPVVDGNTVSWRVETLWRSSVEASRMPLLTETQVWRLCDLGDYYFLDLDWTLYAETDLTFGKYAYGGLFLRMPYKAERGGSALNSEGQLNHAAEQQRARWVAVSMPVDGREMCADSDASITILDHPRNAGHPAHWRIDGQLGVAPSRCIAGEWTLACGESSVSKYRIAVRAGRADAAMAEKIWQAFSQR